MNNYEFYLNVLYDNWIIYVIILLSLFFVYFYIIKSVVKSIIDPLFVYLVFAIFANSIPPLLFFTGYIDLRRFSYFIISESLFWIAYFFFRRKNMQTSHFVIKESIVSDYIFFILLIIYVSSTLLTYAILGIPLFKDSRLETYANSGGLGILSHFIGFSSFYCNVYAFYMINRGRLRLWGIFAITISVIFALLSGSKSAILSLLYALFIYKYFYTRTTFNLLKYKKYLPLILVFPLLVISLQSGANFFQSIYAIIMRLIANGDCYWMGYGNDVIDEVVINDKFLYLFSRILAPFRLIDYSQVDLTIGVQIDWLVVPSDEGIIKGPNTRLPILSWVLFRWGGLFCSFIFGIICAWWHTRLYSMFPRGIVTAIVFGYIYISFASMFTDPLLATGRVFSIVVFVVFLYILYLILGGRYIKYYSDGK